MCRWVSTIPGITMPSEASISRVPSGTSRDWPTAAIKPSTTSTSPPGSTVWASSMVTTVPPRKTIGAPTSDVDIALLQFRPVSRTSIRIPVTLPVEPLSYPASEPVKGECPAPLTGSSSAGETRATVDAYECPYRDSWRQSTDDERSDAPRCTGRPPPERTPGPPAGGGLHPDPRGALRDDAAGRPRRRGGQGRGTERRRHPPLEPAGPRR